MAEVGVEDLTKPAPHDIWYRMRSGFGLPWERHPLLDQERQWYASHPDYLERVTQRAEPFLYFILDELEKRDLPSELALLPIVESAFQPFAYSHGRAAGIWQFIPSTGRLYGLKQNWWYDGRRDVYAATIAACDYLQRLHKIHAGDWLHALAAYNAGSGTVMRAIRNNKRTGKPTDFWHLKLPKETRGYVPKLLALKDLVANPEQYGVKLHPVANEPQLALVNTGSQIDLAMAAELANMPLEELHRLNAGFNRWATDPDGPHRLLLPSLAKDKFAANLALLPTTQRISWKRHRIKKGETLSHLAKRYKTTISQLRVLNDLAGTDIREGKHLIIPVSKRELSEYSLSVHQRLARRQATARQGEKHVHRVTAGDTLWDLARRYRVSTRRLAAWNGMAPRDLLKPGQKLVVWIPPRSTQQGSTQQGASQHVSLNRQTGLTSEAIRKIRYTVRRGDSLSRIAQKFNVRVADLQRWNEKIRERKYLQPGQRLTLFVDVRRQSS
jgi:membrane-bound lytic murein transglycosylase D